MKQLIKSNLSVVVMLIALYVSSSLFAQPPGGGQQVPPSVPNTTQIKKMVTKLSKELSMTEQQEARILKIYTAHFKEVKQKMDEGRPNKSEMEALEAKFTKQVKAELDSKQQNLFDAFQKKNRPQQSEPPRR